MGDVVVGRFSPIDSVIDDIPQPVPDDGNDMTDVVTHRELDARLEAVEARMDGRLARIETAIASLATDFGSLRSEFSGIRAESKETRIHIWGGVGVVLSVIIAGAALLIQSFDSGRDTAAAQSQPAPQIIPLLIPASPTTAVAPAPTTKP